MPNRLADEASPYLRQHADNPVDWWPWREDALAAARAQGKPILLSIGYSACHWCHVMAHESFEDAATAALMNELYICIKVDREERPDLDKIYQLAQQALTRRSGGWPLTVFLAPDDHLPFYAGTYFPREPRYGMPPFSHILQQVRAWWDTRRDEVRAQNSALAEFLAEHGRAHASGEAFDHAPLQAAVDQIQGNFDPDYGGHIGAPRRSASSRSVSACAPNLDSTVSGWLHSASASTIRLGSSLLRSCSTRRNAGSNPSGAA